MYLISIRSEVQALVSVIFSPSFLVPHQQAIYQAEPSTVQTLHSIRERVQYVGHMYKKRYVRIQTIDGHVYDGVIVNVDQGFLYLHTRIPMDRRAFPVQRLIVMLFCRLFCINYWLFRYCIRERNMFQLRNYSVLAYKMQGFFFLERGRKVVLFIHFRLSIFRLVFT